MKKPRDILYAFAALTHRIFDAFGVNLLRTAQAARGCFPYIRDYRIFASGSKEGETGLTMSTPFPCLADRYAQSGTAKGAYFHQDLLVAQKIHARKPRRHIDVGSSVSGFVAHVASYRMIEVLDVRPLETAAGNIRFRQLDLMSELPDEYIGCCDSLSCLHALEHFGLGRYGDPIAPEGHLRGWENLCKMLEAGGTFYFAAPIGPPRIEFNAHRVFSVEYLMGLLEGNYRLESFSYVDDAGNLHRDPPLEAKAMADSYGCHFGCGIFELIKL